MASLLGVVLLSLLTTQSAWAADCKTATVGKPYSTCYDIATAAMISTDKLMQYNPKLDCSALQLGQKVCVTAGNLPTTGPKPNPDGSCATYKVQKDDYCALIGSKVGITAAQIEQFNTKTYKWKGCNAIQVGQVICVSTGTPPPIPVNPNLQCGPESPSGGECPLKACCSAFGFCGITSEFCDPAPNGEPCMSNCGYAKLPTCDGSQLTRNVGYYAGWAATRTCDPVSVAQLDLSKLTHVIYAFAIIDANGVISWQDSTDGNRLKELVTKAASTKTKVSVAVGGWAFSQEANKDRFSVMIGSSANRSKFIASVKKFIADYKINGIDIDFEYPASVERGGPPTDTPNLTLFFKELRAGIGSSLISVATPAGYWFLKGFEMDKIVPNLDFINMMTYDYHGPWDATIKGSNSTAEPQSSLLDMNDSALLYVKAGVDLKKVNLGLAWYGRSYKLLRSDCTGYGCDMTAGGTKGKCTGESGVLGGFEVTDIMLEGGLRPIHHKASETLWFNYKGDLITFDDDNTRAAKTQWGKNHCFGGTMIWSIDMELPKSNSVPGPGVSVQHSLNPGLGATWAEPKQSNDCAGYGNREWSARLWNIPNGYDWVKACEESPVMINGVRYDKPDECDDQGFSGGVIGKWYVSDPNDKHCRPKWGSLGDDGCVGFGKHQWWARLWDIPSGVDWYTMCATTPVVIDGKTVAQPDSCDDYAGWGGEIGVWKVDDEDCKGSWGSWGDNGCVGDNIGHREVSSKLFDIIGSWEDACNARSATYGDEYFEKPTKCEKHVTGIWGVLHVQDSTCGVPPCPDGKSWNYDIGGCADCGGNSAAKALNERDNLLPSLNISQAVAQHRRRTTSHRSRSPYHAIATPVNATSPHLNVFEKRNKWCDPFYLPSRNTELFVQIPDAWNGRAAEGPSAAEIAESTTAQQAFQEAWNDSFNTPNTAQETGGWIYADPEDPSRIFIRRAPRDRSTPMNQHNPPPHLAAGIDLWRPETAPGRPPPAGWVLVANFHTHPMGSAYGGNSAVPSTADHLNAWARGVPGIVINRTGLVGYGPERRAQLNAPQGYPMANEEWAGQGGSGHRLGDWRPDNAPNQNDD